MKKMTRAQRLDAMKAAGSRNDQSAFLNLYTEGRISYEKAIEAFRSGARFAKFVERRDAAKAVNS